MLTKLLKSKIHNASVTATQVDYHGSILIDSALLKASGILPNEAVLVVDCNNGSRFETYVIAGEPGSGQIEVYGAAARLTSPGNKVIIMAFVYASDDEIDEHESHVVLVDVSNRVTETIDQPTRR